MHEQLILTHATDPHGSQDAGAGDHDELFGGFRPYRFSTRGLGRLLQLRSELLDERLGHDLATA
jgi:hypothetical protein